MYAYEEILKKEIEAKASAERRKQRWFIVKMLFVAFVININFFCFCFKFSLCSYPKNINSLENIFLFKAPCRIIPMHNLQAALSALENMKKSLTSLLLSF